MYMLKNTLSFGGILMPRQNGNIAASKAKKCFIAILMYFSHTANKILSLFTCFLPSD